MPDLPLSTLLSQALIAHTIEFDDLAEQKILHGTTVGGLGGIKAGGVWFTSRVMWTNFIRHITTEGRPVREVQALACLSENTIKSRLHHLEWWSYVSLAPDPADTRSKPRYLDLLVKLTGNGARAAKGWAPIAAEIDKRWKKRFGTAKVQELARSLTKIVGADGADLPDYMPVVGYQDGMRATLLMPDDPPSREPAAQLDISALLSRTLLALTLEYERSSDVSLVAAADVLRVVDDGGTSLKDLPLRAGVAKEGVVALVNFLKKQGYVSLGTDKAKTVKLKPKGKKSRADHRWRLASIEKRWEKTFGRQTVEALRKTLDDLTGHAKFVEGLRPHQGGWRLNKRYVEQTNAVLADPRAALPHHPMITHRGGFPDGS